MPYGAAHLLNQITHNDTILMFEISVIAPYAANSVPVRDTARRPACQRIPVPNIRP